MISAVEFKKQISKPLAEALRSFGFKGSGFNYLMDTEHFVFTIGIQASRDGGKCCAEFGFQPKSIDTDGSRTLDFKKLKYYDCEFRTRLAPIGESNHWWQYASNEHDNLELANQIIGVVKNQAIPFIQRFQENPNLLESIEVPGPHDKGIRIPDILLEMRFGLTAIRWPWVLAKALSITNPVKARAFAKYGLSKAPNSGLRWDFEEILALVEEKGA